MDNPSRDIYVSSSIDVIEQASVIWQWNQEYSQLSRGMFSGIGMIVKTPDVDFVFERMNKSTYQTGIIPAGHVGLGIALAGDNAMSICGSSTKAGDLILLSGQSGYEFHSADNMEFLLSHISQQTEMYSYLKNELGLNVDGGPGVIGNVGTKNVGRLRAILNNAVAEPNGVQLIPNHLLDEFSDSLFDIAADRTSSSIGDRTETRDYYWKVLRNMFQEVTNNASEVRSIEDLIARLQISRGTMQTVVKATLGMKASEFLRAIRLNKVLRDISLHGSVTDSATRSGFFHFGHFAREYKKLFGELPSQTLRRTKHH
jgi:AraC family ethanolamine operon transcriptional activator